MSNEGRRTPLVVNGSLILPAHGFGPVFSKQSHIKDGTPVAVVFLQCVTSAIGPKATLALSIFFPSPILYAAGKGV